MTAYESIDTSHRRKVGRPSKGPRHTFTLRLPEEMAVLIARSAQASELTYTDWIQRVLEGHLHACGLNFSTDAPAERTTPTSGVPSRRPQWP